MSPAGLRGWYEGYLDACNRHDLGAVREHLHPDVRRAGRERGADAWIRDLAALLDAFPDYRWKRILLIVEDDRIAAHLRTRGTHRGTWRGIPAGGRHVSIAEFASYRVVDGRIVEYAGVGDDLALLEQVTGAPVP